MGGSVTRIFQHLKVVPVNMRLCSINFIIFISSSICICIGKLKSKDNMIALFFGSVILSSSIYIGYSIYVLQGHQFTVYQLAGMIDELVWTMNAKQILYFLSSMVNHLYQILQFLTPWKMQNYYQLNRRYGHPQVQTKW